MTDNEQISRLAALGVATVYEASGREGLLDLPLTQLLPGSRVAGPARTVLCGQDDNLMVHAIMEHVQPGEVLVLTMPEPNPVALVGELLATQAKVRGAAAILVDAAVRDAAELVELGLPIWTRHIRVKGATKTNIGQLNGRITVGGTVINPGDIVVLDADGAVSVKLEQLTDVLVKAEARLDREAKMRARLEAGEMSFDIHGLRAYVEAHKE